MSDSSRCGTCGEIILPHQSFLVVKHKHSNRIMRVHNEPEGCVESSRQKHDRVKKRPSIFKHFKVEGKRNAMD